MRILFATVAADGHFNPLTGIAVHLQEAGRDVRTIAEARRCARAGAVTDRCLPLGRVRSSALVAGWAAKVGALAIG